MNENNDALPITAWILVASVLLAAAVRLGVLLWYWSANSPYAWGIG